MAAVKRHTGEWAFIVLILALGAWIRLLGLDIGWFLQDQVRDGMAALGIVSGRAYPLVGPQAALSSVNLVGPLYYYLLAIPYAISPDPWIGLVLQNLLTLIALYLVYRLGNDMFGTPVGLVAAALYAVFPMAVISGKTLWNPGFLPFFAALFLWTLWCFLVSRRPWLLAVMIFVLGVLLQIHMSGAIFVLVLPVALLLYRPPLRPWPLLVGILGVMTLYAPYIVFEIQQGFPDFHRLFVWIGKNPTASFWAIAWRGFWTPFVLPEQMAAALPGGKPSSLLMAVQRVEAILICLGVVALVARLLTAQDRRPYVLLSLWIALPFAIVPHNTVGVMWYYFDLLYPAYCLAVGLLAQGALSSLPGHFSGELGRPWRRLALGLLVAAIVVTQGWSLVGLVQTVHRTGVLSLPSTILLNFTDPEHRSMETMPLRHKRALAEHFWRDFGADHSLLEARAHGAIYQQFREDKGFILQTVARRVSLGRLDPTLHYLLLRHPLPKAIEPSRVVPIGPYAIVSYQPMIQYGSWRWSVAPGPGWWQESFDDGDWSAITLPARRATDPLVYEGFPSTRWPAPTVTFRGQMLVTSLRQPCWLVVNIRDSYLFPHEVGAFYLNGQRLEVHRIATYNTVNFRNLEVAVDLTSGMKTGSNLVAFEVSGGNDEFDLDVYELCLTPQADDG